MDRFLATVRLSGTRIVIGDRTAHSQGARQAALLKTLELAREGVMTPREIADYITGTELRVDGGYVVARSTVD